MIITRQEIETRLCERAWTDDTFRTELLQDTRAVLARELAAWGLPLPDYVTVNVHEETPTNLHLVLPCKPGETVDAELNESDLDLVAGGTTAEGSAPQGPGYNSNCV